jgi:glycosyltransferase involved in cell wall biosynthesis
MRVLALTESDDHVCYRYRWEALREFFVERGAELQSLVLRSGIWPFCRQLPQIAQADVVVLQRRLLARWKLRLLRRAARRLVFDLDDAVFLRDSNSPRAPQCPRRAHRFQATVRAADWVTAGNEFLAEQVRTCLPITAHQRVAVVPTVVDPSRYSPANHADTTAAAQLVWIGSRSTLTSLAEARPALGAAGERLQRLRLKIICDAMMEIPGIQVVAQPWSEATEAREIAAADIGISWLPDHPWSAGKCGLKILQYMAAGLPVVANPVAMHKQLVQHAVTGFLASTPDEWATAIERLIASPDLRRSFGQAARTFIKRHYSTQVWGPRLAERIATISSHTARQAA